jgi:hypothetical protein
MPCYPPLVPVQQVRFQGPTDAECTHAVMTPSSRPPGSALRLAELIPGHETVAGTLFKWLGVADQPRLMTLSPMSVAWPVNPRRRTRATG